MLTAKAERKHAAEGSHAPSKKPVTADAISSWLVGSAILSILLSALSLPQFFRYVPLICILMPMREYSWKGRSLGFRFLYLVGVVLTLWLSDWVSTSWFPPQSELPKMLFSPLH
jgi:hypothetical protein